jgi:metallophosphoesterase superfamily enzyme|tara:strand:+ start:4304 stop:4540 length:237 start_codon:yes stop_codon:yes gene_type:complete
MRVRDLQEVLAKFTNGQKGSVISDCHIYIESLDGFLEDLRRIELQESKIIGSMEPARVVFKADTDKRFQNRSGTWKRT